MILTYKCPSCGANMVFNSEKQLLVCEHCQNEKTVEELQQYYKAEEKDNDDYIQEETMDVKSYQCPSCGAQLISDENTTATFCNFCGNAALIEGRLKGINAPQGIIPFLKSKDDAVEAFKKWSKNGMMTPKSFVSQSTIEKITGVYVPFWLFDYDSETHIDAKCTKVRVERHGDDEITHTDYFDVYRKVRADFDNVPADASEKMDDEIMDKLEPFIQDDIKKFEMPYLSGYISEKYGYSSEELQERVENRLYKYSEQMAENTINGYATVNITNKAVNLNKKNAKYVLMPVWLLNYRYNNENYTFAMNGQTGKIVGKLPISKSKVAGWFCLSSALAFFAIKIIELIF